MNRETESRKMSCLALAESMSPIGQLEPAGGSWLSRSLKHAITSQLEGGSPVAQVLVFCGACDLHNDPYSATRDMGKRV
jgi:hypothetical protein